MTKSIVVRNAETNRVAKQIAHGSSGRVDRGLAEPNVIKAVRIEPGTVHAGDPAVEVGDACDHRRPGLGRQVLVRTIVAARMEAEATTMVHVGYSTTLQVGLSDGALNRT